MSTSPADVMTSEEMLERIAPGLDERTLAVIERLRTSGGRRGRGWLVRRALALADIAGLALAFGLTLSLAGSGGGLDRIHDSYEFLIFALSLPLWIIAANLYGLYSDDEERTDHSTADDLFGVFHLVTVGSWLLFLARGLHQRRAPQRRAPRLVLARRHRAHHVVSGGRTRPLPPDGRRTCRTR